MNKHLLPYEFDYKFMGHGITKEPYSRRCLETGGRYVIWQNLFEPGWKSVFGGLETFPTKEAAMKWLDGYLAEKGFIFISPERAIKLKLLLK